MPLQNPAVLLSGGLPVVSKTSNYTATPNDCVILCDATGGAITITLPPAASSTRKMLIVKKTDVGINAVTIDGNGTETIEGSLTKVLSVLNAASWFICDGSAWYLLGGI